MMRAPDKYVLRERMHSASPALRSGVFGADVVIRRGSQMGPHAIVARYKFVQLDFLRRRAQSVIKEFVVFSKTPLAIVFCSQV